MHHGKTLDCHQVIGIITGANIICKNLGQWSKCYLSELNYQENKTNFALSSLFGRTMACNLGLFGRRKSSYASEQCPSGQKYCIYHM